MIAGVPPSLLIRNAVIVTMDDRWEIVRGAVSIREGRIVTVGAEPGPATSHDVVLDAEDGYVLPGFVHTHLHLCQTIFRGHADELSLLDWLSRRIWPLEAAHTPATLRAAARVASAELLLGGTTCVLTMETVHDTEVVFETLAAVGLRATVGKCMMDAQEGAPPRLREATQASIDESVAIRRSWDGAANGRLRAAFAPRFALSCSRTLLEAVAELSRTSGALVHTHAAESRAEVDLVARATGARSNLQYFADAGLASPRLCAAHCVWVDEPDMALLAERDVKVLHCPGSNLKLGSGIGPIPELIARGVCVSLGADGAACNNQLDMFAEMRLAATAQAVRQGPGALTARTALAMATRNGARSLGLEREIGSIEPGKRADLILVDRSRAHLQPDPDPYSTLVYAGRPGDVRATVVDGRMLVRDFRLTGFDEREIAAEARAAAGMLIRRAGL